MEYLFSCRDKLIDRLRGRFVFLFLDYDGTLAPIAQTPKEAVIPLEVRDLLGKLSKASCCSLAIISGRSLGDIETVVGVKGIIYVGNHGLEIEGPKIKFESPVSPRSKSIIRHIYEDAVNKLSKIKGALIEDKGLAVSVHYRLVDEKDIREFLGIFHEITDSYIASGKIRIDAGKKVYEIKPPVAWNKGKVVLWLLARQQFLLEKNEILPVYIGDDVTDEDAFKVLRKEGLTIFVGEQASSGAQYYLKTTDEVTEFLRIITGLSVNKA